MGLTYCVRPWEGRNSSLWVDYRKLNPVMIQDPYPIKQMDKRRDSLGFATIFLTLDATCRYWQIGIAEENRDKPPFTSQNGLLRFTFMPFGIRNGPVTLQREMDVQFDKSQVATNPCRLGWDYYIFAYARRERWPCSTKIDAIIGWWCDIEHGNCDFSQIASIIGAMQFALGGSKFPHKQLTPYADWNAWLHS